MAAGAQEWAGVPADAAGPPQEPTQWAGVPVGGGEAAKPPAEPAAAPQQQPSAGQHLAQSQGDIERAIAQHVNPNALSEYFPGKNMVGPPSVAPDTLGKAEESELGITYRNPAIAKKLGLNPDDPIAFNPKTDVVLRDPKTGELTVYARNESINESPITSFARSVSPYMLPPVTRAVGAAQNAPRAARAAPEVSSASQAMRRAADIERDIGAFERQGVRPAPIAFSQGPMAGVGQMTANIPYIGDPIRRALDVAAEGTRNAAQRVAEGLAPSASVEQVGQRLQSGLDRFRTAGVRDVEPGQLRDIGVQPRAPGQYVGQISMPQTPPGQAPSPNRIMVAQPDGQVVPLSSFDPQRFMRVDDAGRSSLYEVAPSHLPAMSTRAAQRAEEAAPIREQLGGGYAQTHRGVQVPAAQPWGQTIMGRRSANDLSPQELQALVGAPAQDTSFAARAEGLYERSRRMVPNFFRADESRDPSRLAAANTRTALGNIDSQIANQIGGQAVIGGNLADRLRAAQSHFGLDDLFAIRTEVGRALGTFGQYQQNLSRGQLKQLYGAISSDIEVGLRDLANRAMIRTQGSNNAPNYIRPQAALTADGALRAFRTADRYFRQGISGMDRFARIAGTDNPQAAVRMLISSTLDGTKGNLGMLRSAMAALRPEERNQFTSLVINEMGKPLAGVKGVNRELEWSPTTFTTNWDRMDPGARRMLFTGQVARDMDDIVNIAGRLANQEAMINTSRSGTHLVHFLTLIGSTAMAMNGHTMLLAGLAGPTAGLAFAMSRPSYVGLVAKYARLRAGALDTARGAMTVNPQAGQPQRMATFISQLDNLAARDPALIPFRNAVAAENGVGQELQDNKQKKNNVRP